MPAKPSSYNSLLEPDLVLGHSVGTHWLSDDGLLVVPNLVLEQSLRTCLLRTYLAFSS